VGIALHGDEERTVRRPAIAQSILASALSIRRSTKKEPTSSTSVDVGSEGSPGTQRRDLR
jgi:hypothetical protein